MTAKAFTDDEIAEVFWDCLKRDPDHKDRRMTTWGSKTRQGLAATVRRLGAQIVTVSDAGTAQADWDDQHGRQPIGEKRPESLPDDFEIRAIKRRLKQ